MSALAPLEAAIFARLQTLQHNGTATNQQPFALVARYAGPVNRDGVQGVCAQYPCLLLRRGRAKPRLAVETLLRDFEMLSGDVWTLLIVLEEGREIDDAVQGLMPDAPGLLPLHDVVEACINGLHLSGLWTDRPVLITEYGDLDALTQRGVAYAAYIEIRADRTMERAALDDPAANPLDEVGGDMNLPPDAPSEPYNADTRP